MGKYINVKKKNELQSVNYVRSMRHESCKENIVPINPDQEMLKSMQ